ncbi:hypothetical protein KAR91_63500 [Candidatus Pacearchaeota archaeon]|nr:hypothetical protein [Candidatus Pacearchaeota archaeon]
MSRADLDFLRLATWDITEHTNILADFLTEGAGEWEHSKWLQYHGWKRETVFLGTGYQKKRRHSVINISGYAADRNYRSLLEYDGYYATRIDLQITIEKPELIYLPKVYRQLRKQEIKTSLISSEKNDTLYVGARTSDVFTRLYEKPLEKMYLRLEFEFKGKVARAIWRALQGKSTVDEIFQHYLEKSKLPPYVKVLYFEVQDGATAFATRQEIAKSDAQRLEWLQSIDAAVRQALYNHNIGDQVQALVMFWANEAANVDIINEMN